MHFCSNCSNMYYIRINADDTNKLVYYCRKCGNEDSLLTSENICVSKINIKYRTCAHCQDWLTSYFRGQCVLRDKCCSYRPCNGLA